MSARCTLRDVGYPASILLLFFHVWGQGQNSLGQEPQKFQAQHFCRCMVRGGCAIKPFVGKPLPFGQLSCGDSVRRDHIRLSQARSSLIKWVTTDGKCDIVTQNRVVTVVVRSRRVKAGTILVPGIGYPSYSCITTCCSVHVNT